MDVIHFMICDGALLLNRVQSSYHSLVSWICNLFLSLSLLCLLLSCPFQKWKFINGYSSPLHAGTKHRCQWPSSKPFTKKFHLKCWHDVEDVLAVFSFWIKFPLEHGTLHFLRLSSGKLWQQEKTSSFLVLDLLAWWNWIGREYGFT